MAGEAEFILRAIEDLHAVAGEYEGDNTGVLEAWARQIDVDPGALIKIAALIAEHFPQSPGSAAAGGFLLGARYARERFGI